MIMIVISNLMGFFQLICMSLLQYEPTKNVIKENVKINNNKNVHVFGFHKQKWSDMPYPQQKTGVQ